jgi:L-iditol 2-dehydrogenase
MKALVKYKDGPGNMELRDIPEPHAGPGKIKIEVMEAGVCGSDLHIYDSNIAIATKPPVVIGHEFSGIISEIGEGVSGFKPGDRVVAEAVYHYCRECKYCREGFYNLCIQKRSLGYWYNGSFAHFTVVPAQNVHRLPDSIDFLTGSMLEPLACVCHAVYDQCHIEAGNFVLVSGPGAIGLTAAQVAKAEGAQVILTGTDADTERFALAKKLGVDYTVDIQKQDLRKFVDDLTDGYGVDVVLECSGSEAAIRTGLEMIKKRGWYCLIALPGKEVTINIETINYKELHFSGSIASRFVNWEKGIRLVEMGLVKLAPLASHHMPLEDWKKAFEMYRNKEGMKLILTPPKD